MKEEKSIKKKAIVKNAEAIDKATTKRVITKAAPAKLKNKEDQVVSKSANTKTKVVQKANKPSSAKRENNKKEEVEPKTIAQKQDSKEQAAFLRKTKALKHHNKLPSYVDFNSKAYHWKGGVDYRKHPELYKVGKGEQGVLLCQPYKGEILPHWKFATPEIAEKGSKAIYQMFLAYLEQDDLVGADMARKFLQMGFTRARRYYNFKGGKKYSDDDYAQLQRGTGDPQKYESSNIYFKKWREAEAEPKYKAMKAQWRQDYG